MDGIGAIKVKWLNHHFCHGRTGLYLEQFETTMPGKMIVSTKKIKIFLHYQPHKPSENFFASGRGLCKCSASLALAPHLPQTTVGLFERRSISSIIPLALSSHIFN